MIHDVKAFEEKMKNNHLNYSKLSKQINLKSITLSNKIKGNGILKLEEALDISQILKLDKEECIKLFF